MPDCMITPTSVDSIKLLGREFDTALFKDEQELARFEAGHDASTDDGNTRASHHDWWWKGELSRRACQRLIDRMDDTLRDTAQYILDDLCAMALDDADEEPGYDRQPYYDGCTVIAFGMLTKWLPDVLATDRTELLAMDPEVLVNATIFALSKGLIHCPDRKVAQDVTNVPTYLATMAIALTRPVARIDLGMDDGTDAERSYALGMYVDPRDKHIYDESEAERRHLERDYTYDISEDVIRRLVVRFISTDSKIATDKVIRDLEEFAYNKAITWD